MATYQTTLNGYVVMPELEDESYGNDLPPKPESTIRSVFQNVNGITPNHWTLKSKELLRKVQRINGDVTALAEMNYHQPNGSHQDSWSERVRASFPQGTKSTHVYNTTEAFQDTNVHGGVGMICTKEITSRFHDISNDPTDLGRWTSVAVKGKHNFITRFISAYNPVDGRCVDSVLEQHTRFYRRTHDDTDPRKRFELDLSEALEEWIDNGETVILMLDANQDIRQGPLRNAFTRVGLREMILNSHLDKGPAPATYARNTHRTPIDAIFTNLPSEVPYKCGYLGFGDGLPGDHRMAWIDIPYEYVFGHTPPHLHAKQPSRLTTKDPRIVSKYHEKVKDLFDKHGVFDMVDTLVTLVEAEAPMPQIIKQYDKVSYLNRRLRKEAEGSLRKLRMGDSEWSPEYAAARDTKKLWYSVLKLHLKCRISRRKIKRQMRRINNTDAFSISFAQVRLRLQAAHEAFAKAKKESKGLRKKWMDSLASAAAKKKNTTKAKVLKAIKHREKQRRDARSRRMITGKGSNKAKTTTMYYTEKDPVTHEETRFECSTQDAMGKAGARENETRMTRCLDSPFMQEPLYSDFGDLADTPAAEQVLNGDYVPPEGCNPFAEILLRDCKIPDHVRRLLPSELDWTPEELEQAWTKQNIQTSAEPTGLSFAHLMLGAKCPELAVIDTLLHNLPFRLGFSPKSWQIMTDVAILKKPGVYDVELMRTIMLMDSYYNMNNKRLGRLIMTQAEAHSMIPHDQYGSRKLHRSDNQALNKNLIFDIYRLKRWAAAILPMDASQCYDRMVHSITSLAVRSTGIPMEPVRSRFATMQDTTHHIATAYGVSTQTHGGKARQLRGEQPEGGAGQGSGSGPAEFVILSAKMIRALSFAGLAMLFLCPISGFITVIAALMFVDDSVPGVSGSSENSLGEDVLPMAQRAMDMWEGCLAATGGAINCKKSCWYLLDYRYEVDSGKWRYRRITDMPGEVTVKDVDGSRKTLQRMEPDKAAKYLGIWPTPDGSNNQQAQYLLEKTEDFAGKVRRRRSAKENDVWITLQTTIMKTLEYPMRAISLRKEQWKKVVKPIMHIVLPRCGISRSFPRDVLFAPSKFQGMDAQDPWTLHHLKHIEVAWETTYRQDLTGKLLNTQMEEIFMALGTGDSLTLHSYAIWSHCVTNCWLKDLWQFCDAPGLGIETFTAKLRLMREGDQFLMKAFAANGYSGQALADLNQCRMWLKVITLSDICDSRGRLIHQDVLQCRRRPAQQLHSYTWPRQPQALSRARKDAWTQALTTCFLTPYHTRNVLRQPLGQWNDDPIPVWPWLFCPTNGTLYHREGLLYQTYTRPGRISTRGGRFSKYTSRSWWSAPGDRPIPTLPPGTYHLADVTRNDTNDVTLHSHSLPTTIHHAAAPQPMTIASHISAFPPSIAWSIGRHFQTDNGLHIATAIISGSAIAVSDGSYKDGSSTSGFILEGNSNGPRIKGYNKVPGASQDQSSHRGELGGILGILMMCSILCKLHAIDTGSIKIGLDNSSALKSSEQDWDPMISQPDFDLIAEIRAVIASLPISVTFKWVEGHQDRKYYKPHRLPALPSSMERQDTRQFHGRIDRWASLNIECDAMAKEYWVQHRDTFIPLRAFPHAPFSLSQHGQCFSRFNLKQFYSSAVEHNIKAHWHRRQEHMTGTVIQAAEWDDMWKDTHWEAQGKALQALPLGLRRWTVKHATGHCGVGRQLLRRGWQHHSCCPRCNADDEDTIHILRCPDRRAKAEWTRLIKDLQHWLQTHQTSPRLVRAIIACLMHWHDHGDNALPVTGTPMIRRFIHAQNRLGWWAFLLGRVSKTIVPIQDLYMQQIESQSTGDAWLSRTIQQVIPVSFNMWQHRNSIKHGTELTQYDRHQLQQLRLQVKKQFRLGTSTLPTDEHWRVNPELETAILDESLIRTSHWLESVQLAREIWSRQNHFSAGAIARQQHALQEFMAHGRLRTRAEHRQDTRDLQSTLANRDTAFTARTQTE